MIKPNNKTNKQNQSSCKNYIDYFSSENKLRKFVGIIALYVRRKIFNLFITVMKPNPAMKVIDIGATPNLDLPDSNFFEQFYPYQNKLTAVSFEDLSVLKPHFPQATFVKVNSQSLPFTDQEFDIAFSSATLEHTGDTLSQKRFIAEMLRVANSTFLITPYRWFPVEMHTFFPFIHWLPHRIFSLILRLLGKSFFAQKKNLNLLNIKGLLALYPNDRRPKIILLKTLGIPSHIIAFESIYAKTAQS